MCGCSPAYTPFRHLCITFPWHIFINIIPIRYVLFYECLSTLSVESVVCASKSPRHTARLPTDFSMAHRRNEPSLSHVKALHTHQTQEAKE